MVSELERENFPQKVIGVELETEGPTKEKLLELKEARSIN